MPLSPKPRSPEPYFQLTLNPKPFQFASKAPGSLVTDLALGSRMQAYINSNPKALRTHILRLLGPKTILQKAFGLF